MASRAESAYEPRSYLVDASQFGQTYTATLRTDIAASELGRVAASVAQHRAACVLIQKREAGEFTSRDLAHRLGINEGMLSRYLTGAAPLSLVGLFELALELEDASILPELDDVYAAVRRAAASERTD